MQCEDCFQRGKLDIFDLTGTIQFFAEREIAAAYGTFFKQAFAVRVVSIDNHCSVFSQIFGKHQLLSLIIVFHIQMIVKMIAGEIGENRRFKAGAAGAVLVQSVA